MRRSQLLDLLPKESVGAEIGVWKGDFSARLLDKLNPIKLYLVDPWQYMPQYSDRWYGGELAKSQQDMDLIAYSVVNRFKYDKRVSVIRGSIHNLPTNLPLDFCYIDGNHSYDFILEDLSNALSLMKDNSILCGDDYDDSEEVRNAVRDFLEKNKGITKLTHTKNSQFVIEVTK